MVTGCISSSVLLSLPLSLSLPQDMFYGHEQDIVAGGLSVAVPGEVAGMHEAWRRHGSQPWRSLVLPAARLAREGFPASEYMEHSHKVGSEVARCEMGGRSLGVAH